MSQCFLTGADLSYTNEILSEGGLYYNELGEEVEPFAFFAEKGTKIVRLRLWHTPSNNTDYCGDEIDACGLEDVLNAALKVKANGMQLKLSIHYSDYFADPGTQKMPEAWEGLPHETLLDSISNYTTYVLDLLLAQNTLPEIVSVGNETTWGFIDDSETTEGFSWPEDQEKFNAAFDAIDAFNELHDSEIKKAVHFTESSAAWATGEFIENGIENFDIIGISYYPFFSPDKSLDEIGTLINNLYTTYGKEIMIFETGFVWTEGYADEYGNFMSNNGGVLTYPMNAEGQRDYLLDFAEVILENNGSGLIYWEPSWITSELCDKWSQGSFYENVTFFDLETNRALEAFDFFEFCDTVTATITSQSFSDLTLYPNPLSLPELTVQNAPENSTWKLVDVSGKPVSNGKFQNNNQSINLSETPAGTYFLFIISNSSSEFIVKRLVIL